MGRKRYQSKGQQYDGKYFASQAELKYYQQLQWQQKAGEIKAIQVQPEFPIVIDGVHICKHRADFMVQYESGKVEYIDVKSKATIKDEVSIIKRRLVEAVYHIKIRTVCV